MERKRKKLRLPTWDYSSEGSYFVTFCVKERHCILWEPRVGATLGRPALSPIGKVVEEEVERIDRVYPSVRVDKYVVMPNHVHLILTLKSHWDESGRARLAPTKISTVIQQTKGRVSKRIGFSPWQKSFHDHVIRNYEDYLRIWQYIDTNPMKWELDCYYDKEYELCKITSM